MKKLSFFERLLGKSSESEEDDLSNLDVEKREMIKGIIELSETSTREIMVARTDVVFLSLETPIEELLATISECGHSRLPVYEGTIDNVVGVLYAKDLLQAVIKNNERFTIDTKIALNKIVRKPYFVPESKKLNSLLKEFKKRKVHLAIVVDEYGGTSGIVSFEDIIEEIFGEIQDEYDNETEEIMKIGDNVFLCDARVNIEDINERFSLELPAEDFDTLGGFVFDLMGKIPVKYEKVTYEDIDFIIQEINGHKIESVKIVFKNQ